MKLVLHIMTLRMALERKAGAQRRERGEDQASLVSMEANLAGPK